MNDAGGGSHRVHSRAARQASSAAKLRAAASVNEWLFSTAQGTGVGAAATRGKQHSLAGELWGPSTPVVGGGRAAMDRSRRHSEAASSHAALTRSASDGLLTEPSAAAPPAAQEGGSAEVGKIVAPPPLRKSSRRSLTISTSTRSMPQSSPPTQRTKPAPFSTPQAGDDGGGDMPKSRTRMTVSEATSPVSATPGPRPRAGGRRSTLDSRPGKGMTRGVFTLAARVTSYLQRQGVCASKQAAVSLPESGPKSSNALLALVSGALGGGAQTDAAAAAASAVFVLSKGGLDALEEGVDGGALFAGASAEAESRLSPAEGAGHMRSRTATTSPGPNDGRGETKAVLSLYRLLPQAPAAAEGGAGKRANAVGVTRGSLRDAAAALGLLRHLLALEGPLSASIGGGAGDDSFSFVSTMHEDVSPPAALSLLWVAAGSGAPLPQAALARLLLQMSTFVVRTSGVQLPACAPGSQVVLLVPRSNASFSVTAAWRAVQQAGSQGGLVEIE